MKATSSPSSTGSAPSSRPGAALPGFDYQPLGRVVAGAGAVNRLGEFARELGIRRALLVTDPGLEQAGHPQRALRALHEAGVEAWLFDGVEENPTAHHVEAGLAEARKFRIDGL